MTIAELISSSKYPKKAILEKLVCHVLHINKESLFTDIDRTIEEKDLDWIDVAYTASTIDKKPLEYILWYVEFTWIRFEVSPKTLIPRPETEYMIQAINEYIQQHNSTQRNVLDVWTWCWVLWLSVYYHNQNNISNVLLSELDPDTLLVAKKNSSTLFSNDKNINFVVSSLLQDIQVKAFLTQEHVILVANLPYIPEELFENNTDITVRKREPKMAFVWWDDGCDLYRDMFNQLLESQTTPTMFLEMMTWQVDVLRKEYPQFIYEEVKTFHFNIRILKVIVK